MSDKEEEWKPNGRPQSTMALSFAASLDNAFSLDSDVDNLSNSVHYKKQQVTLQSRELERLEAKIREAESRLQGQTQGNATEAGDEAGKQKLDQPDKNTPDTAVREDQTANENDKADVHQFPSDSSGSHASDEDSAGSAESPEPAMQAPSKRYYRKPVPEVDEKHAEQMPGQ